jgi:putative aminopeptidase FrvX
MQKRWLRFALELLSLPTAPLREEAIIAWLRQFASERDLESTADRWGNLCIQYRCGRKARAVAFCAHMDHPGFCAVRMTGTKTLLAEWRGGVPAELFRNSHVRFHSEGEWVRGVVLTRPPKPKTGVARSVRVRVAHPVLPGSIGMWDFPETSIRDGLIYARGHDCVIGVAALASLLDEAWRQKLPGSFHAMFTRCEEGGFLGAIGAARSGTLPAGTVIVSLEASRALPNAPIGGGAVIRVGDRASIFSPHVSAWLWQTAGGLAKKDRNFKAQRRLMDGGTCESSVYASYGYETGGLCIPLGNYHNVDWEKRRLGAEFVSAADYVSMVKLLLALARTREPIVPSNRTAVWEDLFRKAGAGLRP